MDIIEIWPSYKSLTQELVNEFPASVSFIGEVIVSFSPALVAIIMFLTLVDKFFERRSVQFVLINTYKLLMIVCKLFLWTINEVKKEPEDTGLLSEAPIKVKIIVYKTMAFFGVITGSTLVFYASILFMGIFLLNYAESMFLEFIFVLGGFSILSLYLGYIQLGLAHQNIKLYKSLKSKI